MSERLSKIGLALIRVIVAIVEIIAAGLEAVTSTIAGTLAILRVYLHRGYDYKRWLKRDLADCETILELGCGEHSPLLEIGYGYKTDAVDIYQPYISRHNTINDYHSSRVDNILDMGFPAKSYDAVVMLDVLEHLPRNKVYERKLFEQLESCARKRIIIFSPNGWRVNGEHDENLFQSHVSAWSPLDFQSMGFTVHGATSFIGLLGNHSEPKLHPYAVFLILAMLSQPYVYNHPYQAFHSYAVKEIK